MEPPLTQNHHVFTQLLVHAVDACSRCIASIDASSDRQIGPFSQLVYSLSQRGFADSILLFDHPMSWSHLVVYFPLLLIFS